MSFKRQQRNPGVETDFQKLIQTLAQGEVSFIVVGGAAATAHGSARLTMDLDIVYGRDNQNLARLVAALTPLKPYLRGAPAGLPFEWSAETLKRGLNFTLITSLGALDVLGEITGGGCFEDLLPHSVVLSLHGSECLCLELEWLIRVKRAAGRPKDLEAIAELEVILEEKTRV